MKTLISTLFLILTISAFGNNLKKDSDNGNSAVQKAVEWILVWEDNFDKPGLPDRKIWDYEVGYIRNKEEQYYTKNRSENARVENGSLVIEARKDNWENHKITSASLKTLGKKSILYGRVEVRAKLPTGRGTWPAIWMLGENIGKVGWPSCGAGRG